jgi:hypothetical protein
MIDLKVDDMVRVKLDGVSYQWFHALIVEVYSDHVVVDTMFHVAGKMRWKVKKENIKSLNNKKTVDVKSSPSLNRQLKKVIRKQRDNLGISKTWHDDY